MCTRPPSFVALAGALVAWAVTGAPSARAEAPTSDEDPGEFFVWSGSFGLGAALRVASRVEREPPGGASAATGLGQLQGRLAAYDHSSVRPGVLHFIAVDVSQTLDFGGTVSRDMSMRPSEPRRAFAVGTSGTTAFRLGFAGEGRGSWYLASVLEQRFAAHRGGDVEGAHYEGGVAVVGGLRLAAPGRVVVQVGPLVGGLSGIHDLERPRFFGILAVGGDLGLYARPAPRLQLAWTARAHRGFFDAGTGARSRWRTTLDLARRRQGPGTIRSVNFVVIYEGERLDREASASAGGLGHPADTRVAHAVLVGLGVGFGRGD